MYLISPRCNCCRRLPSPRPFFCVVITFCSLLPLSSPQSSQHICTRHGKRFLHDSGAECNARCENPRPRDYAKTAESRVDKPLLSMVYPTGGVDRFGSHEGLVQCYAVRPVGICAVAKLASCRMGGLFIGTATWSATRCTVRTQRVSVAHTKIAHTTRYLHQLVVIKSD